MLVRRPNLNKEGWDKFAAGLFILALGLSAYALSVAPERISSASIDMYQSADLASKCNHADMPYYNKIVQIKKNEVVRERDHAICALALAILGFVIGMTILSKNNPNESVLFHVWNKYRRINFDLCCQQKALDTKQ